MREIGHSCDLGSKAIGSGSITVLLKKEGIGSLLLTYRLTVLVLLLLARRALTESIAPGFPMSPVHRPFMSHKIVKRASKM